MPIPHTSEERARMVAREQARTQECSCRRAGSVAPSCGEVDILVGWPAGMSIDDCDQCFRMDPSSAEATQYRAKYAADIVAGVMRSPIHDVNPRVILTIAGKHLSGRRAEEYILNAAPVLGEELAVAASAPHGADLERAVREKLAGLSETEAIESLAPRTRWDRVKDTWDQAYSFSRSIASRGVLQQEEAPLDVVEQRAISCTGVDLSGEKHQEPCPSLRVVEGEDTELYCNDCGCGDRPIARLDGPKWRFPYLKCPRRRPGFSNAIVTVRGVGVPSEPQTGIVIENICHGIGDAVVYSWLMHSARAAGIEVYLNPQRSLPAFDIFSIPDEWRTTRPGPKEHPPKGVVGQVGWLRSWLRGYGVGDIPFVRPPAKPDHPSVAAWADNQWQGRDEATHSTGRRVLIFPEVVWKPREWPPIYYSILARDLIAAGYNPIVMTSGWADAHIYPWAIGGVTLYDMVALMRRADIIVGNDSGPCHFAGTLDKPFLALTGPSPKEFFEHMPSVTMLTAADRVPCTGCNFEWGAGYHKRCDVACASLLHLTPDRVLAAIKERLP